MVLDVAFDRVDEAVGVARGFRAEEGEPPVAFTRETKSCLFSAGKPLVAIAVALLESRGLLDVARPVATYFPEFGRNGKSDITVLDVGDILGIVEYFVVVDGSNRRLVSTLWKQKRFCWRRSVVAWRIMS